jgi:catechol 2,3-dioxygenase-like lactoylglutathione lyase family enzyme
MASFGIPGLRGTDHVGFTVPDLDAAVAFFRDVIGCDVFYSLGAQADETGTRMRDKLGVDPRTRIRDIRLVRCKNGANFEIFQYEAEDQVQSPPRNSDIGGHHLAFYVDDINAATDYLIAGGIQILDKPEFKTEGPSGGEAWVYFLSPWGMQMELVSFPDGKSYEKDFAGKLWDPRSPSA